jgi:hypothetical protein
MTLEVMYANVHSDPRVLEDVQRALRSKALRKPDRDSLSTLNVGQPSKEPTSDGSTGDVSTTNVSERVVQTVESVRAATTPSRSGIAVTTQAAAGHGGSLSKVAFPSMSRSPTRSMESMSSLELTTRSPLPVLMSLPDGTTYLDWSGNNTPFELKDRSIIGRTLSLTRRKPKKSHTRNFSRPSLDQRGSQGDLHSGWLYNELLYWLKFI